MVEERKDPDKIHAQESSAKDALERAGVFTSGIMSAREDRRIALFFTGHKHAGKNLADVLRRRAAELNVPIQMCDALWRNLPEELKVILANCIAHYLESNIICGVFRRPVGERSWTRD